ncbi:hypothetical protein ACFPN0_00305 [Kitasatospora cinereorecta]
MVSKTPPLSTSRRTCATPKVALLETRIAYEEYAKGLPWSAEPMPAWQAEKQLHSAY